MVQQPLADLLLAFIEGAVMRACVSDADGDWRVATILYHVYAGTWEHECDA